jgi:hypothetical protein
MRIHDLNRIFARQRLAGIALLAALSVTASGCTTTPVEPRGDTLGTGLRFEQNVKFFCDPVGRACLSLLDTRDVELRFDSKQAVA